MMMRRILLVVVLFSAFAGYAQDKQYKIHTVAFYNLENLFDAKNDPKIKDEEYLPTGKRKWTDEKYHQKLKNLSRVIADIGTKANPNSPTLLGVSEVENRGVLEDLVKEPSIADKDYGIIHFDSPDRRGIDVALLYQKKYFIPTSYKNIPLIIYESDRQKEKKEEETNGDQTEADDSGRIFTRDQLLVTGLLDGEEINVIVNHWPSRYGGEKRSSPLREAAAALNKKIIDSLYKVNPNAKIITMGDLNDGPYNKSVKKVLGAKAKKENVKKDGLYNPMEEMSDRGIGTLAYRDAWDLFDQMIVSEPLIRKDDYKTFTFWKAGVFNKDYLTQKAGRYRGYPKRNWNGIPGYSDHFPVYLYLIKEM